MSTSCPQCGNSLDQDFGVVTCPKCSAVLFVDMDGNAKATGSDESPEPPAGMDLVQAPAEHTHAFEMPKSHSDEEPAAELDQQMEADPEFLAPEPQQEQAQEYQPEPTQYAQFDPEPEMQVPPEEEPIPVDPNDLSDVSEYANSDQAFGPLSYSVIIENIDTSQTRQQLLEALTDSKFAWDSRELLKQVKLGKLKLENLNPVKASVLIQRLQDVPVKVSWTQNVFS